MAKPRCQSLYKEAVLPGKVSDSCGKVMGRPWPKGYAMLCKRSKVWKNTLTNQFAGSRNA
jgi:hypothetical protein